MIEKLDYAMVPTGFVHCFNGNCKNANRCLRHQIIRFIPDIGGLFITPLEKDFKKINPELLRDVYQQVCLSDRDVEEIFVHLSSN